MKAILRSSLALACAAGSAMLAAVGCQRTPVAEEKPQLPAYVRNLIVDPELRTIAEEIQKWADKQVGAGAQPLYSRCEVLPVAQTVQPYGVGAFQQEPRLPVILTTGPGWAGLPLAEKEGRAAQAFRDFSERLQGLKQKTPIRPTLTLQTPQGMELAWINHLDPSGKNLHGDE